MKYVCELCGNVYDEAIGDPRHGISAGTAFADLPGYYGCAVCGSEKEAFTPAAKKVTVPRGDDASWQYTKYSDEKAGSER